MGAPVDCAGQAPFSGPDWTDAHLGELKANERNGRVGVKLVSQTDRLRLWHIALKPGERLPFHRHVNDYFWTALAAGKGKSRDGNGGVAIVTYRPGDTMHYQYGPGESRFHDLENIGESDLLFVTVEFLNGANDSLPLGPTDDEVLQIV